MAHASIGKVAPIASAAGVSLEEVLAAVAQLTRSGLYIGGRNAGDGRHISRHLGVRSEQIRDQK